jgi:hypothetical protein
MSDAAIKRRVVISDQVRTDDAKKAAAAARVVPKPKIAKKR